MARATPTLPLLEPATAAVLGRFDLVARTVVEGFIAGLHRSVHHGFSVEFDHHTEYRPGDDLRHLDWRVWARLDRFYLKQYEEETNMRVHVVVDASGSMGFGSAGATKLQYAARLAACLCYLGIRQKDPTALAVIGESLSKYLPPRMSAPQLRRLLLELEALQPAGPTNLPAGLGALAQRLKRRGLLVIISDLLTEPGAALDAIAYFAHRKHEVLVLHVLDPAELNFAFERPAMFADLESGRQFEADPARVRDPYLAALRALLDRYQRGFAANAIDYAVFDTATPLEFSLAKYLARRSRPM
jgi:uncharacterized protein (DUF58 family)